MSVDKIVEKIIGDAEAEARRIEAEASRKVEEIEERAAGEIRRVEEEAEKRAEVEAREQCRRLVSAAQLELRKGVLTEKQNLISQAFERALKRLVELKKDGYQKVVRVLLLKAVEGGDEEIIVCSKDRDRVSPEFLAEVNAEFSARGKKGDLKLSEENRDLAGGFVLRKGRRETNCSFESILASVREELEPKVAEMLFKVRD